MATTKRPQNKCGSCGYTWYPRGKSVSNKCPNCGSAQVSRLASGGGVLTLLVFAGVWAYSYFQPPKADKPPASPTAAYLQAAPTTPSAPSDSYPLPKLQSNGEPKAPQLPESAGTPGQATNAPQSTTKADETLVPTNAPKPEQVEASGPLDSASSPTSICKNEGNFISRNNCEWKECEKPEFASLAECANKKQKGVTSKSGQPEG